MDIEEDLKRIALMLSNANIESAVACLVAIALRITHNTTTLLGLLQKCYERVMSIIKHYENNPSVVDVPLGLVSEDVLIHFIHLLIFCRCLSA